MALAARQPVLYIVACGGRPSGQLPAFVSHAQEQGWDVCVISTPDGWPNVALARHPVFVRSVATLREWGVRVILDPARLPQASGVPAVFPWQELRAELVEFHRAVEDRQGLRRT